MKKLYLIFLLLTPMFILAQGLTNNGGNITIQNGAYMSISGTNGHYLNQTTGTIGLNGTIELSGNWTNNGNAGNYVFSGATNNDGLVIFKSANGQTIAGSESSHFENFTIENNSGININFSTTNDKEVRINGNLNFNQGIISTQSNYLTLSASSHVTGPGNNKYVFGNFKKEYLDIDQTDNPFTFPVGTTGGINPGYSPAVFLLSSRPTSGSLTVSAVSGRQANADPQYSLFRYWKTSNNLSAYGNASATFFYLNEDFVSPFIQTTFESTMAWGKWISNWTYPNIITRDIATHNITIDGITNISGEYTGLVNMPIIIAQPNGGGSCSGGNYTFTTDATGSSNLSYQWYKSPSTAIAGATNSSYTIVNVTAPNTGQYFCVVTNNYASSPFDKSTTNTVTLTINTTPSVYNVTGSGEYCAGGAGIPVGLNNSQTGITYQLYLDGNPYSAPIPGNNSAISFGNQSLAGTYTVVASNGGCTTNMSGNAIISLKPSPLAFNVTGGGTVCTGSAGAEIKLDNSQTGCNYTLLRNGLFVATVAGTNNEINFGFQTNPGTYTVTATNLSGCSSNMLSQAVLSSSQTPLVYNVTGGGAYCSGNTAPSVSLNSSQPGVNYQLILSSSIVTEKAGTGFQIDFGSQASEGQYSVMAVNIISGCTSAMNGSVNIVMNTTPIAYMTSGGGSFCEGSTGINVNLNNSQLNVNYTLWNNGTSTGISLPGTGNSLTFTNQTGSGTYTIVATTNSAGCSNNMNGSALAVTIPAPAVYAVSGGGSICSGGSGLPVVVSGSQSGINYNLQLNGSNDQTLSGNGNTLTFSNKTSNGTYTVVAINPITGCSINMSGRAIINVGTLPTSLTLSGGGAYCSGGSGLPITLPSSQPSVSYQLYRGVSSQGSAIIGNGSQINFPNQTQTGTYTVIATNTITGCSNNMSNSIQIFANPLPATYNVSGTGSICTGATGIAVGLSGSQSGINYKLYLDNIYTGNNLNGTGINLNYGNFTQGGTYTIIATNLTTNCSISMLGSAVITVNQKPTVYNISTGGTVCSGSSIPVTLSNSQTGVSYQLYRNSTSLNNLPGNNAPLNFGNQTLGGTYTIIATNTITGCTNAMSGNSIININSLPTAYNVLGGGALCAGGAGANINLSSSQAGVRYQLRVNSIDTGIPKNGTGSGLTFSDNTTAGTYTIIATNISTNCSNSMSGSQIIIVNPTPTAFNVTGGGAYCTPGSGLPITLSGTETGINYQLKYNTNTNRGTPIPGTGNQINFPNQTSTGTYTVVATNIASGCTANMTGSTTITANSSPTNYSVSGGGSFCTGGTGVNVNIPNSQTGINYLLLHNSASTGTTLPGTGAGLSFTNRTAGGTYTVIATNATTLCSINLTGQAIIIENPLPSAYDITGGGSLCTGANGLNILLSGSQTGLKYQLKLNSNNQGLAVNGTGNALTFTNQSSAGTYTIIANNPITGCSSSMNGSAIINISSPPQAFSVSGGGSYCSGAAGLNITLSGSQLNTNYQLKLNNANVGTAVSGNNSSIDFGVQSSAGTYTVLATSVSTSCSSLMNNSAVIIINPLPNLYNVTGGGAYCEGNTPPAVNLSNSQAGVAYQLKLNGINSGSPVNGTNSPISFGNQSSTGSYTVVATNSTTNCSTGMSGMVVVTSSNPVNITSQPTPLSICINNPANFSLTATGSSPLSYQWYKNSSVISNATNTVFSIASSQSTDAANYYCIVSNSCGGKTSNIISLNVYASPTVIVNPGNNAVCQGNNFSINSNATGTAPFTYLWYKNSILISGSTSSQLSISNAQLSDAGTYTSVVSNTCGSTTGNISTILVNNSPSISAQPSSLLQCAGSTANFNVSVQGVAPFSYKWYKNSVLLSNASNSTFTVVNSQLSDAGTYSCIISNTCGNITSNSAILTINNVPAVSFISAPATICSRDSVTFKLTSSGINNNYQWAKDGNLINGATNSSHFIQIAGTTDAGTYTCTVSNNCGIASASTALIINPLPLILTTYTNQQACEGSNVTYSIQATGPNLSYQWTKGGANIPGETKTVYTKNNLMMADGNLYSCNVRNECGSVNMKTFVLQIISKPSISIAPIIQVKPCGDSVIYTLNPQGAAPFSYTWYKNVVNVVGDSRNILKLKPITPDDAGTYSCIITNNCGSISSQIGTIVVPPCNPSDTAIYGVVFYNNNNQKPLSNDSVYLYTTEGVKVTGTITNSSGQYVFTNLSQGNYVVKCKATKKWGGVNPTDALNVTRYYVGIYNIKDNLCRKAADVNNDTRINTTDALLINRRYVAIITKFNIPDWIFEEPVITYSGFKIYQNIKAICAGDVDGSYNSF